MSVRRCYHCAHENPEQLSFCGTCGSPLALKDYLDRSVKEQIRSEIEDRDVLETESAIRVFERVWRWVRIYFGVFIAAVAIVAWQANDLWNSVKTAQQNVLNTHNEVSQEAATFKKELENSRAMLQAASELKPAIETLRNQLETANKDIREQQKMIESSETFVKKVFRSHITEFFRIGQSPQDRYAISPPLGNRKDSTIYLLVKASPVPETLQLQFHIYTQPYDTYMAVHNLVMFCWGDPIENVKTQELSVSYFPDKSDNVEIHSMTENNGRVFADNEPLPRCGEADFKGNKWLEVKDGDLVLKDDAPGAK